MLFNLKGNLVPQRRLHVRDFYTSFLMLKYPSVVFPFWYYTCSWAFVNILPAISMASIYSIRYHFTNGIIGLCIGIPLTIGCVLGELCAGKLSDLIMYRLAKRHDGQRKPEHRLFLTTPAAFLMPAGVILFGVCVERRTHWVIPLVGLGIGKLCPLRKQQLGRCRLTPSPYHIRLIWAANHLHVPLRLRVGLL